MLFQRLSKHEAVKFLDSTHCQNQHAYYPKFASSSPSGSPLGAIHILNYCVYFCSITFYSHCSKLKDKRHRTSSHVVSRCLSILFLCQPCNPCFGMVIKTSQPRFSELSDPTCSPFTTVLYSSQTLLSLWL